MNFTTIYDTDSYKQTILNQYYNDTDIERCSEKVSYNNKELNNYTTTTMKLELNENILLTKYYEKIKSTCQTKKLSKEEMFKYNYRPEALSSDYYNTPNLWYLILKVNSCEDFSEFYNIEKILLPDINIISDCLTNEEYILSKDEL